MSALAEALVAAQRRALAQLEKAYVRGIQDDPAEREQGFRDALKLIGLPDREDAETLINCLEVLRETGGAVPTEANGAPAPKLISDAQRTFIGDLVKRANVPAPDLAGLTHEQASELISSLKAGTYDPSKWSVPF